MSILNRMDFGVTGIIGTLGSGKTLFMAMQLGYAIERGYKVYANFDLKGGSYLEQLNDIKNYSDCYMGLDDIIQLLDSRTSTSNRVSTYLFVNVRKQRKNVFWSAQVYTGADMRLRAVTNVWVFPYVIKFPTFGLRFVSPSGISLGEYKITYPKWIIDLYDTEEIVSNNISYVDLYKLYSDITHKDTFCDIVASRYNIQKALAGNVYEMLLRKKKGYVAELLLRNGFKLVD